VTERNLSDPSGVYPPMNMRVRPTAPGFVAAPGAPPPAVRSHPLRPAATSGPDTGERTPAPAAATAVRRVDFTDFYRDTWPGVARALTLVLGDAHLAVDATDEAMARAYPRWDKLSGYDNPAGWVYRVGLNWARSHHRRMRRKLPFARGEAVVAPAPDTEPAVRDALLALPVKQRGVVVCRLLLDWSVEDTAAALGIRPGTVQSRLHRAVHSLEQTLKHLR
jgi:RNA polymerase sigma-70 factor (ECF subfamily)